MKLRASLASNWAFRHNIGDARMKNEPMSPRWAPGTKLIAGFTLVALVAFALGKFQAYLPPVIMTFLLVYLLYPVAKFFEARLRINWGLSIALVYLLLIAVIAGLATISGFELVSQVQSLIGFIQSSLEQLPEFVRDISERTIVIGPLVLELNALDLSSLSRQILDASSALLSSSGNLVGVVAGTALNTLLWGLFILIASLFILGESKGLADDIVRINAYDYTADLQRAKQELANIWNSFFRGQLTVIATAIVAYAFLLNILGVRFAFGLAFLIGAARFFPYVGAGISWVTLVLVTFFQASRPFGLTDISYVLLVFGLAFALDVLVDYFIYPRVMGNALRVHPAGVLFSAIIGYSLLGILGVILAAPMLATLQLMGRYVIRKLFDVDPWAGLDEQKTPSISLQEQFANWREKALQIRQKISKKIGK
jgi:predicted PurR-regulated permease PerM